MPPRVTVKRTFLLALAACLLYFCLFIPPNARGAQSERMLQSTSVDEPVTYPYVVRMLTPASDLKDLWTRWVIYGDYHYGYPFYFFSALVLLPVRLVHGAAFTNFTQLNLLLLRQLISVLPMLAAALMLTWMATRFRSALLSLLLLTVLLSLRAVVRNNIQWWHPDALSVLAVVLTLFFLERDDLRFGRNFYFAAAACGVAAGIKLAGFFFFLAVAGYLAAGILRKALTFPRSILAGALFVLVMGGALVLSNPFLYNAGARQELAKIQSFKTEELTQGYAHDDPRYYAVGPRWWEWTLTTWYAHPLVLGLLGLSLAAGCVWGPNRLLNGLILLWIIPNAVYLLFFVAVKPDHYWLPVLLPLFATMFNIPMAIADGRIPALRARSRQGLFLSLAWLILAFGLIVVNITRPYSGNLALYRQGMQVEAGSTVSLSPRITASGGG